MHIKQLWIITRVTSVLYISLCRGSSTELVCLTLDAHYFVDQVTQLLICIDIPEGDALSARLSIRLELRGCEFTVWHWRNDEMMKWCEHRRIPQSSVNIILTRSALKHSSSTNFWGWNRITEGGVGVNKLYLTTAIL